MKKHTARITISLSICTLALLGIGCYSNETFDDTYTQSLKTTEVDQYPSEKTVSVLITEDVPKEAVNVAVTPETPLAETLPPVLETPVVERPSSLFARSVFDDDINIEPWRANYVGSYGVLPTRFQDKGPFLYSFDISPNADIFHDDDLGPIDFRHRHRGDDDE